jgi:hypothetical protein
MKYENITCRLLVEFGGNDPDQDYGEIIEYRSSGSGQIDGLDRLSETELRAAVRDWLTPCPARPFTFIVKGDDGKHHLIELQGDFKIADAARNILEKQ